MLTAVLDEVRARAADACCNASWIFSVSPPHADACTQQQCLPTPNGTARSLVVVPVVVTLLLVVLLPANSRTAT